MADVAFGITLNTDEQLDVQVIIDTLLDIEHLLTDIERQLVPDKQPTAHWEWGEEAHLAFTASANGVSAETLGAIARTAHDGFRSAAHSAATGNPVQWPDRFGRVARDSASRILRRLALLQSISVQVDGEEPVEVREANLGERITSKQALRRVHSSVEGVLQMIAHQGPVIHAGIREHGTRAYVRCRLAHNEWYDRVRGLWDARVVVEGRVAYDPAGRALSIIDVTSITLREGGKLRDFRGAAPDLAASTEAYLAGIRPDG